MPESDKVERILEAARLAPTWANKQGVEYIIVKDSGKVKQIRDAIEQEGKFTNAPMFIIGIISPNSSGVNKSGEMYYGVDFGICFEHLILAATAEGLATCWIGWFNEEKVKDILKIPKKYKVMGMTPLGYPIKPKGEVKDRKNIKNIIHNEEF